MTNPEQPSPVEHEPEPTSAELAAILGEYVGPEAAAELAAMELDEAIGYAYTLLIEQGEDPDEILLRHGFIEE